MFLALVAAVHHQHGLDVVGVGEEVDQLVLKGEHFDQLKLFKLTEKKENRGPLPAVISDYHD